MKASIIIPAYNNLEYTKQCVRSIEKNTPAGLYEIIAVDNGSQDGTSQWLAGQKFRSIINPSNLGVAKAWNMGCQAASGEYLCIINNDILTPAGWLEPLLAIYEKTKGAGIISPGTRWGELDYDFDSYAAKYMKKMKGVRQKGFGGWCMLISAARYREIGVFDERFDKGIGEDTDYYLRLKQKGCESYICGDSFIHHFGSKTLHVVRKDEGHAFEENNIKKLREKWDIKNEPYFIRKGSNFLKFITNIWHKITRGFNLDEKRPK